MDPSRFNTNGLGLNLLEIDWTSLAGIGLGLDWTRWGSTGWRQRCPGFGSQQVTRRAEDASARRVIRNWCQLVETGGAKLLSVTIGDGKQIVVFRLLESEVYVQKLF